MNPADFQSWAASQQSRIEALLEKLLPSPRIVPERLHAAMRYAVLGGGKRIFPEDGALRRMSLASHEVMSTGGILATYVPD